MNILTAIAVGGAVGAVLRWRLARFNDRWPRGTFAANMAGCFLLGLVLQIATDPVVVAGLGTGLLGGLTTFSTFAVELATEPPGVSRRYVSLSVLGGVVLVLAGGWLGSVV